MKKNVNKQQHVQLGGMAFYDESKCFLFAPNEHGAGLKVFCDEGINIGSTLVKEAEEAADALVEYQLKR